MRTPKYRVRPDRDSAFVEVDGRRIALPGAAHSVESKDAYRRIVADYHMAHQSSAKPKPVRPAWDVTVTDVAAAWLDHCREYYGSTSNTASNEYDNCRLAARPLVTLFGDLPIVNLTPAEFKRMRDALAAGEWLPLTAKRPVRPWSRQHINVTVSKLKRMLRWGVEAGMVPPTVSAVIASIAPLQQGRSRAKESTPVDAVPAEVVDATVPYMPPVVAAMVRLQQLTGMRSDNVCSLRPCDVDRSGDVWTYRPSVHKSRHRGKVLQVPLGPQAQAILRPFLERNAMAYCFSPREVGKYTVHQNRVRVRGERYITNTYRNAVRRAVDTANRTRAENAEATGTRPPTPIPYWHPHQLRHLRAEQVKRLGGLEAARALLGHSSVKSTEIYDARDLQTAADIARQIG